MTNQTKTSPKYSPEVRERAVRMVFEHRAEHASQWSAITSIAAKIGCTAQTLSTWVKQAECDQGLKPYGIHTSSWAIAVLYPSMRSMRRSRPRAMVLGPGGL